VQPRPLDLGSRAGGGGRDVEPAAAVLKPPELEGHTKACIRMPHGASSHHAARRAPRRRMRRLFFPRSLYTLYKARPIRAKREVKVILWEIVG
jgi:hypothetical protein